MLLRNLGNSINRIDSCCSGSPNSRGNEEGRQTVVAVLPYGSLKRDGIHGKVFVDVNQPQFLDARDARTLFDRGMGLIRGVNHLPVNWCIAAVPRNDQRRMGRIRCRHLNNATPRSRHFPRLRQPQ